MAHFLKPNPTALRKHNILRTGRIWKDPQGQVSSLSPLGCTPGGQGQGRERINGEEFAQFLIQRPNWVTSYGYLGHPGPAPFWSCTGPLLTLRILLACVQGLGHKTEVLCLKASEGCTGPTGPFSLSPSYIPSLLRRPPPSVSLLLYMGHGLLGISDLCTFCSPGLEHPPDPILRSKFIPIL